MPAFRIKRVSVIFRDGCFAYLLPYHCFLRRHLVLPPNIRSENRTKLLNRCEFANRKETTITARKLRRFHTCHTSTGWGEIFELFYTYRSVLKKQHKNGARGTLVYVVYVVYAFNLILVVVVFSHVLGKKSSTCCNVFKNRIEQCCAAYIVHGSHDDTGYLTKYVHPVLGLNNN